MTDQSPLGKIEQLAMGFWDGPPGRMLQLGNKLGRQYADWFTAAGWTVVVVDLNGCDGALPIDLTVPGALEHLGKFDMVTNFGTTEHVPEQDECWASIHKAVAVGGMLACITPLPGHWERHGRFYPTMAWYDAFARQNGYKSVFVCAVDRFRGVRNLFMEVCAVMRKKVENPVFDIPAQELMWVNPRGKKVGSYDSATGVGQ